MKKLSKLKLNVSLLSDNEMKSIVGGDMYINLPEVTIYGNGKSNCDPPERFYVQTQCNESDAHYGIKCRSADCKQIGQCRISLFTYRPFCATAIGDHILTGGGY